MKKNKIQLRCILYSCVYMNSFTHDFFDYINHGSNATLQRSV